MIMAFCYKTKEIMSHRNRRHKEEQLSITLHRGSFSKNEIKCHYFAQFEKQYASSFFAFVLRNALFF